MTCAAFNTQKLANCNEALNFSFYVVPNQPYVVCVCVCGVIWEVALSFSPYILLFYYFTIQFLLLHHLILYSSSALGPCERVSFGFYVCHYKSMPTCINYKPNVIL